MTSTEKMILGLGVGIAIGAALGILYAPDKGKETRRKISDGFDQYRDKVVDAFDNLKQKAGCKAEQIAHEISEEVSARVSRAQNHEK